MRTGLSIRLVVVRPHLLIISSNVLCKRYSHMRVLRSISRTYRYTCYAMSCINIHTVLHTALAAYLPCEWVGYYAKCSRQDGSSYPSFFISLCTVLHPFGHIRITTPATRHDTRRDTPSGRGEGVEDRRAAGAEDPAAPGVVRLHRRQSIVLVRQSIVIARQSKRTCRSRAINSNSKTIKEYL